MKSFSQFSEATTKTITYTFGRFSPPTVGHERLFQKVESIAKGGDFEIFPSQSEDPKKNPLPFKLKVKYLKDMFPKYAKHITVDTEVKTALDALFVFYAKGYTKVQFVVGSDRLKAFEFLKKYNGVEANGKYYNFPDGIHIVSAGDRDPEADDAVSAMSASKLRAAAAAGDIKAFKTGMPKGFDDAQSLFNDLRKGMKLKPIDTPFREHVQLPKVSDHRERYVRNEILKVGSQACAIKTNMLIVVKERKANYIIDEDNAKHFISDLIPTFG